MAGMGRYGQQGMGMECRGYGYGNGYGRYGYGYGRYGYGYGRYGYGMQRVMVGDMVWQAARRVVLTELSLHWPRHHCLGEEVRALNDIDAKQLDEKQMGSVIYLWRC